MLIYGEREINTMEKATEYLRECYKYEPYNIYYVSENDSIEILSADGEGNDYVLSNLEEVNNFYL